MNTLIYIKFKTSIQLGRGDCGGEISGGLYLEIALKYKVKHGKNGKFLSIYKASTIDFETQISLRR